jgi:hypothetical protein
MGSQDQGTEKLGICKINRKHKDQIAKCEGLECKEGKKKGVPSADPHPSPFIGTVKRSIYCGLGERAAVKSKQLFKFLTVKNKNSRCSI